MEFKRYYESCKGTAKTLAIIGLSVFFTKAYYQFEFENMYSKCDMNWKGHVVYAAKNHAGEWRCFNENRQGWAKGAVPYEKY